MRWLRKSGESGEAKAIVVLMISSVLLAAVPAVGAPNWAIYADATIEDGDEYHIIEVYDSLTAPPVQTTVTMTGGLVTALSAYETSIVNISGGSFANGVGSFDYSSIYFSGTAYSPGLGVYEYGTGWVSGGSIGFLEARDSGTVNLTGVSIAEYVLATGSDSLAINIYGTDFFYDSLAGNYGGGRLSGNWPGGTAFSIDFYATDAPGGAPVDSYSYVVLHIVPEPSTFALLGTGGLFLKKRYCLSLLLAFSCVIVV